MENLRTSPVERPIPQDITERFDAICAAARAKGQLVCVRVCADEANQIDQYIIGVVIENGAACIPLGIIPTMHVAQFIKYYDGLVKKSGGAEADPEFKGVRM